MQPNVALLFQKSSPGQHNYRYLRAMPIHRLLFVINNPKICINLKVVCIFVFVRGVCCVLLSPCYDFQFLLGFKFYANYMSSSSSRASHRHGWKYTVFIHVAVFPTYLCLEIIYRGTHTSKFFFHYFIHVQHVFFSTSDHLRPVYNVSPPLLRFTILLVSH